jgi:SAM-dependent methyltransferase
MEPRGNELITRYKLNYSISADVELTEEMILQHWDLEKELTRELWESTPENRWEIFERAYTRLYSEIDFLNQLVVDSIDRSEKYKTWAEAIGSKPKKIYEIGSGKGGLILYLSKCEFECKGTEITKERGEGQLDNYSSSYLSWGNSDGINLEQFEPSNYYDVVLSNQVIEHLHPDDLQTHFQSVYSILNENGRYIFSTPHCHTGPHDISSVFKYDKPIGMHLKEYTYKELIEPLTVAGFKNISYVMPFGINKLRSKLGIKVGSFYFNFMLIAEKILFLIPTEKMRRPIAKLLKKLYLFADNIFLIVQK